jgi:hypothetical protein
MGFVPQQEQPEPANSNSNGDLLAEELSNLTVKERERVYEEIHGVADITDETPEFVSSSLESMRSAFVIIPKPQRKALDRALFLRPTLESDDNFYLMFLRSERFNGAKAARKLCRYYENKLELWGDDKLARPITLEDLTEFETEQIYQGNYQFSPNKDQGNRPVHFVHLAEFDFNKWRSMIRYFWYQKMTALEDEEMQKTGVVEILMLYGRWNSSFGEVLNFFRNCMRFFHDWPMRTCSMHVCYDNSSVRNLVDTFHMLSGTEIRVRERAHYGSKLETQYALLSYGINASQALTPGQGDLSRVAMEKYMEARRAKEAARQSQYQEQLERHAGNPSTCSIPYAQSKDVMMKHSGRYWIGNTRLTQIVDWYRDEYRNAKGRLEKTMIAMEIVQSIQLDGGKFVQRCADGWEVVGDQVAKEKVSQALRVALLKQQKEATNTGDTGNRSASQQQQLSQQQGVWNAANHPLPAASLSSFGADPNHKRPRID